MRGFISKGGLGLAASVQIGPIWQTGSIFENPTVNQPFTLDLDSLCSPIPSYTVVVGALPPGLSLSGARNHIITGTPTTLGTTTPTLRATDGLGFFSDKQINFTVSSAVSITTLNVTSTIGGTNLPFTFGQPFAKGDIPSGSFVTSDLSDTQFEARNFWPDGSTAYGVFSGRKTLSANITSTVTIKSTSTGPSGTNLTEANLSSLAPNVSMACGAIGTVTLSSLIGVAAGGPDSNGLVSSALGPVMSEFRYRGKVGANAHLRVYFYVRLYLGNRIEIECVVENGFMQIAGPTSWNYLPTFSVSGVTAWNNSGAALTHYHHSRYAVPVKGWIGGDPQITPAHNTTYLRSTSYIPNFGNANLTAGYLNSLNQSATPYILGGYQADWGGTGSSDMIGMYPNWDAAYCISGDVRAYNAALCNSYIAGQFAHHYRDETTGRPALPRSYPNIGFGDNNGWANSGSASIPSLPTNSGGNSPSYAQGGWNEQHHPSFGFIPYVITGRWFFLEETQFEASAFGISIFNLFNNGQHFNGSPIFDSTTANTTRGSAWGLRDCVSAALATPDSDTAQKAEWLRILSDNLRWYTTNYVGTANNLGVFASYDNVGYSLSAGTIAISCFQEDFMTSAIGRIWEASQIMGGLTSQAIQDANSLMQFRSKVVTGRLGAPGGTDMCFLDASNYYAVALADSQPSGIAAFNSALYPNWSTVQSKTNTYLALSTNACTLGGALRGGAIGAPQGYISQFQVPASYAVTFGATGASAGYQRMTGASNWASVVAAADDNPFFWYVPRVAVGPAVPAWYTALPSGQWTALSNSTLSSTALLQTDGAGHKGSVQMIAWGGAVLNTVGVYVGSQFLSGQFLVPWGGGHVDYRGNEVYAFGPIDSNSSQWYRLRDASTPEAVNVNYAADGGPVSRHTYQTSVYIGGTRNWMFNCSMQARADDSANSRFTDVFQFNIANPNSVLPWTTKAQFSGFNNSTTNAMSAYDTTNDKVYFFPQNANSQVAQYSVAADTWNTYNFKSPTYTGNSAVALDTTRTLAAILGNGNMQFYDCRNIPSNDYYNPSTVGTGPSAAGGIIYDPVIDKFVSWANSGKTIYYLTPPVSNPYQGGSSWTWTSLTPSSGVVPTVDAGNNSTYAPEPGSSTGTYGRFAYVGGLTRGYILMNRAQDALFFFKP